MQLPGEAQITACLQVATLTLSLEEMPRELSKTELLGEPD